MVIAFSFFILHHQLREIVLAWLNCLRCLTQDTCIPNDTVFNPLLNHIKVSVYAHNGKLPNESHITFYIVFKEDNLACNTAQQFPLQTSNFILTSDLLEHRFETAGSQLTWNAAQCCRCCICCLFPTCHSRAPCRLFPRRTPGFG